MWEGGNRSILLVILCPGPTHILRKPYSCKPLNMVFVGTPKAKLALVDASPGVDPN